MKKLSTRKKILVASLLVGVLVVGAIVSLVLVLAAQTQGVSSTINVTYVVEDVGAKVSARYAVVTTSTGEVSGGWVNLVNGEETEHEFDVGDDGDGVQLNPTETEVKLSSSDSTIVYEYKFTNTTESPFTIQLTNQPDVSNPDEVSNMTVAYKSSGVEMSTFTSTAVADSTLKTQLIIEENATTYLYVKANVADLKKGAYYTGNIEWTLSKVDTNDLQQATLDNNGGEGATTVKFLTGNEYQLPHLTTLPTHSTNAGMVFNGYKMGETVVYDANGTSNSSVIPTTADAYTAEWLEAFAVSGTTLTGVTTQGAELETLTIPTGVTEIASNALSTAKAKTIYVPSSVTTIGANAFAENANIETIIIEEAPATAAMADGDVLTTIGAGAFANCENLKHIIIPSNVTTLPNGILNGCSSLETLEFPYVLGVGTYSINGLAKLFNNTNASVPTTLKNIVINGGTSIGERAFESCRSLISVTIGDSVTSIGKEAFDDCHSLTSVTIPKTVTSIKTYAFKDCYNLAQVRNLSGQDLKGSSYPDDYVRQTWTEIKTDNSAFTSTLEIGSKYAILRNGSYKVLLYATDKTITTANDIPSDITHINESAFYQCSSLTSVTIPNSVTSIGYSAFYNCSSLISVTIGNSVTSIGNFAFGYCYSLAQVRNLSGIDITTKGWTQPEWAEVKTDNSAFTSTYNVGEKYITFTNGSYKVLLCVADKNITTANDIPSDITHINNRAFYNCSSLTSVTIPDSVTSIGESAFYSCSSLTKVNTPSIESWLKITFASYYSNPLYFAKNLYVNNVLLTSLVIPDSVTSIGDYAFFNCSSLTSVTIPDSVTSIGSCAFDNCNSLVYNEYDNAYYLGNSNNPYHVLIKAKGTDITSCGIHNDTKIISGYAFMDCMSLSSVVIPDSVISLGDYIFSSSPVYLTLGKNIVEMGDGALNYIRNTTIVIPASVKRIGRGLLEMSSVNSLTFEDPTGWFYNGEPIDVSNPEINAQNLCSEYDSGTWADKGIYKE